MQSPQLPVYRPMPDDQLQVQQEQPEQKSRRSWVRPAVTAVAGVACLAAVSLGVYASQGETFQPNTQRWLHDVEESPAIQITFTPKDGSTNADSRLAVDALLFPRKDGNGELAFDGRISYVQAHERFNFTVVNDRGYMTEEDEATGTVTRNECLDRADLPPVDTLTSAIRNARVIDELGNGATINVKCPEGKLVEFMFANEPYVFCSSKQQDVSKIHGEDVEAAINLFKGGATGAAPSLDSLARPGDAEIGQCEQLGLEKQSAATSSFWSKVFGEGSSWETFTRRSRDAVSVLMRQPRTSRMESGSCNCPTGKKACLFIHGYGQDFDGPLQDEFDRYFPDIAEKAACCSSVKFIRMDTTHNTWYDDALPRKMCDAALSMVKSADPMKMQNIALIAHSMGNLIVTTAAMKNFCAIDPSTSKFIGIGGPMKGSMSSNVAVNACGPVTGVGTIDSALESVLRYFGLCPSNTAIKSLVYQGTSLSTPKLDEHYRLVSKKYAEITTSNMCGVSESGLYSTDAPKYKALAMFSGHESDENDGSVHFNSCRGEIPRSWYSGTWKANYYRAALNHADTAFRNGDGWWGDDRKPIKWLNCQL